MANSTKAFGFIPVNSSGQYYAANVKKVNHDSGDSTALFVGDPVIYAGSANADGYPTVIRATVGTAVTTDRISGVVVGFEPFEVIPALKYGAGSATYNLHIAEASDDQLFLIKADAAVAVTNVGQTCQIASGTGDPYTGLSAFVLDASELANTATDQVVVVGFPEGRPDNEINATGVDVIVRINMPTNIPGSAGV